MRRRATLLPMVVALLEPLADNLLGPPGGQGAVYKAKTADGYIAVKVYFDKPAPSQSAERCLQDELAMLKAVQGQNVLRCLGDDMVESVPPPKPHSYAKHCLKLVLAAKGDLFKHAFCSGPRIKVDDVRTLSKQMVEGVKHIHSQGYAHLDIKPENMLIDANGTLMIADFGLARSIPSARGCPPVTCPTAHPASASPELTGDRTRMLSGLRTTSIATRSTCGRGASILMLCVHANPFACIDARPVGGILEPVQEYVARRSAIYLNMRAAQKKKEDNPVGEAYTGRLEACKGKFEKMVKKRPDLKTLLNGMLSVDPAQRLTIGQVADSQWLAQAAYRGLGAAVPDEAAAARKRSREPTSDVPRSSSSYRSLGADADDEAKAPQYTSCSASAVGDSPGCRLPLRAVRRRRRRPLDLAARARKRGHAHPRLNAGALRLSRD